MSGWITLIVEPAAVIAPPALIYSTKPRTSWSTDGHQYYLKGPDTPTLVAEAVGSELADMIGLAVPDWSWCNDPKSGQILFASRGVRLRSGMDLLIERHRGLAREFLGTCIAFDIWTSNRDRNLGNIVAEPVGGPKSDEIRLVAIDFEKADTLRGTSQFEVTAKYPPRTCWPTNELAQHCRGIPVPKPTCDRIAAVTKDEIGTVFADVASELHGHAVTWIDSASTFLAWRAQRIHTLVAEVWNA